MTAIKQTHSAITEEDRLNFRLMEAEAKRADVEGRKIKKSVVGQFGIITHEGKEVLYKWINSSYSTQRLATQSEPVPMSNYGKNLLESCFKNW